MPNLRTVHGGAIQEDVARIRLLFDQNLSHHLPRLLDDCFPRSSHVIGLGMAGSSDSGIFGIWQYARKENLTVVTKDVDYERLSARMGHPPKVILMRLGNCSTEAVAELLRERFADIVELHKDEERGLLEIP